MCSSDLITPPLVKESRMKVKRKKILKKVTFGLLMFGFMFLFNGNIKADTTVTTEAPLQ